MKKLILCATILILPFTSLSQSTEKASLLYEHGLSAEAKSEAIDILFSKKNANEKAQAYFLLGHIAFENNELDLAMSTWTELKIKYPNSPQTKRAIDISESLVGALTDSGSSTIDNITAQSYISNGDFFSSGKNTRWRIDSSFIPTIDAALKWYDKVITEFPKSKASKLAYEKKIQTLIGWKDSGRYGSSYGLKDNFEKYMKLLLETGKQYFEDHPDTEYKHAFRFQIAQAFWGQKMWPNATEWLNAIIEKSGDEDSFYSDLAKRRLTNLEY